MKKFYITTAIDYVNAPPHIGHAYEKVCADTIARWHRMKNEDVYFLTGTDENAQKNAQAAREANVDIRKFVDENSKKFIELAKLLNLSNNDFIRTTEKRHVKVSQLIFKKLYDKGDIYKGNYSGYYCEGCEAFITEKDLKQGKCPEHHIKPKVLKEETYFFKLSKYGKIILELLEGGLVEPESRRNEIINRVKGGLNDLSVTRKNVDWGIQVPIDQGHKIYVWIDALVNYISALEYPDGELFKKYWPADIHLIGKGINWFHSVIWPAILISCEIKVPKKIFVHGYVNIKGQKISKSLKNTVDPVKLIDRYGADTLRYFLLREIPFGEDGNFSQSSLITRFNSDLANDLGNLLNRALTMIEKYFDGRLPETDKGNLSGIENLKSKTLDTCKQVFKKMDALDLNSALKGIWQLINSANKFIEESRPWVLVKQNPDKLRKVIYALYEVLRFVSILIWPFMPSTSDRIRRQMGISQKVKEDFLTRLAWGLSQPKTKISKEKPIFPRIKA